jgi:hypothetical protein
MKFILSLTLFLPYVKGRIDTLARQYPRPENAAGSLDIKSMTTPTPPSGRVPMLPSSSPFPVSPSPATEPKLCPSRAKQNQIKPNCPKVVGNKCLISKELKLMENHLVYRKSFKIPWGSPRLCELVQNAVKGVSPPAPMISISSMASRVAARLLIRVRILARPAKVPFR